MLAATFTLTNCTEQMDAPVQEPSAAGIPFEIIANAVDTKTTNDGMSTVWAEGDALNVFHAEAGTSTYVKDNEFTYGETENGNFAGTLAAELTAEAYDWYASYPYSSYVKTPASVSAGYMTVASSASGAQTQNGNDSMAHIAGVNYPLYGVAKNVAVGETPEITMNHLTSLIEVVVYNETGEDIVVSNVSFTAPESVIGTYYIDFTGAAPAFVSSGANYVSNTATLNVVDGEAIVSDEDPAKFYLAVKPFTAAAGSTMTVKVTTSDGKYKESSRTYETDVVFKAGKIKKINIYVDSLNEPVAAPEYTLPYEETFGSSLGDFTAEGEIPTGLTYVWAYDSSYGAKASAYVSGTRYAQESYLVSPILNLEGVENAKMSFDHAGNYFGTKTEEATLWVRPVGGEWEQLTIPTYFSSWTFVNSGEIDLSAYVGEKIQIGFKYTSTSTVAGTWEIKNVKVEEGIIPPTIEDVTKPATVAAEGADVTVTYSISNPVNGVSLTATTEAEWITNVDCSVNGEVSFTVAPNNGSSRSGIVTLSYTGAEDVDVVVSQSAGSGLQSVSYTLLFGPDYNSESISAYTKTWSVTYNGFTCEMANWNNNQNKWSYVKAGRKNYDSVATITTTNSITEAITTVTLTVDALTVSKINSLKLYVASDSTFADAQTYSATPTTGEVTFAITSPSANSYYKIEVDCASGSSNGLFTLSKVVFSN